MVSRHSLSNLIIMASNSNLRPHKAPANGASFNDTSDSLYSEVTTPSKTATALSLPQYSNILTDGHKPPTRPPAPTEDTEVDVLGNDEKFYDADTAPPLTPISTKKKRPVDKKKCPCGKSDKSSTYIICCRCKQNWHNKCCNCADLTSSVIKKLSKWECPGCYVCPALANYPASLYVEIQSIRDVLSAVAMRDSSNTSSLNASFQREISLLKDSVLLSHESVMSEKLDKLQQEIHELKESASKQTGTSSDIHPSMKAAIDAVTTLPGVVSSIQANLSQLSEQMATLQTSVKTNPSGIPNDPYVTSQLSHTQPNTFSPRDSHKIETPCKPYELYQPNAVTPELKTELLQFVSECSEDFSNVDQDNSRQVLYFGEFSYKYTGKEHPAKPVPPVIVKLLEAISPKSEVSGAPQANTCLITKYSSGANHIPMHRDNEPIIDPDSHILTVSLGASREMTFTNNDNSKTENLELQDSSLLVTSRFAQDFWQHGISPDTSVSTERVSFTFRHISPRFLNSTILLGDSNTSKISFGSGTGTLGVWMPGKRVKLGHIEALPDAVEIGPYRNIVIHTGINSINNRAHQRSETFLIHTLESKCKDYMRVYPRAKIHISLLLPTRLRHLNQRVENFNRAILDMSYVHRNIRIIDNANFGRFLSDEHGRWDMKDQRPLVSDSLHLGKRGIRMFAMNIKSAIIGQVKSRNRSRSYSSQGYQQGSLDEAGHRGGNRPL